MLWIIAWPIGPSRCRPGPSRLLAATFGLLLDLCLPRVIGIFI